MAEGQRTGQIREDVWIPSVCRVCSNTCTIRVHRKDGVIVKIEGHPESPHNFGRICAKGMANIMSIYDPNLPRTPLVRTNPEKGVGVDPKWREATWGEALDMVAARIRTAVEDDPRKLVILQGTGESDWVGNCIGAFAKAVGTPNRAGGPFFATHVDACYLINGTMHVEIDLPRCRYLMLFGSQRGGVVGHDTMRAAREMAEARARGMKLVVVDPMMNAAGEKADEWLPIRPGTDGALALAMLNVLLNETGIYDREYLREHTNGPYLIGPDGHYVRSGENGKPLVWDESRGAAGTCEEVESHQNAIEGAYTVGGVECRPAFQLLKDHVKNYTPEWAEKITTIPAQVTRRIAREFGEAASVGSTITIDGVQLPSRPASLVYFKGSHGHNHAWLTSLAIELLCEVVGASNVPGGLMGASPVCYGHPETELPRWVPKAGPDGLLTPGIWIGATEPGYSVKPYPAVEPRAPQSYNLMDLLPTALSSHLAVLTMPRGEEFKIPYKPEVLLNYGANSLMSIGNPETTADALRELFVLSFNLWLDETTDFADIVLPDTCYLERLDPVPLPRGHGGLGLADTTAGGGARWAAAAFLRGAHGPLGAPGHAGCPPRTDQPLLRIAGRTHAQAR